jgi:phosphoglycerate kinase
MKFISGLNLKNKRVLLRTDLNSDVVNGRVLMSERIKESAKTIFELKKKGAKVVIFAHQGQEGKSDFVSLKQHAKLLNKIVKINFVQDTVGEKAVKEIKNLKSGEVLLLENVRFEKDEFHPEKGRSNKLIKVLVPLFDIYINDAFSVCHRDQTSITGFPKYLKSFAGPLLEKEVKAIEKVKMKNSLYILGGAKPEDYLGLLKGNKVLACGLFGQSCLIVKGKNLGAQNKYLEKEAGLNKNLKKEIKKRMKNVETPLDFAVKVNGKRKELSLDEFPSKYDIFDIGEQTINKYVGEIKKAKSVYMKGPAGDFSSNGFEKGTFAILKAISEIKGFSLIGGGHLSDAIDASGISKKKFSHISLSGGALLKYIAGEKLPGLEALK